VQLPKAQKIDPLQSYPCPCPKKYGKLIPITLTDALGCDRCSSIFTIEDDGFSLVQLGGIAPYRHAWQWVSSKWLAIHTANKKFSIETSIFLMLSFIGMFVVLLALNSVNLGSNFALLGVGILVTLLILITWWVLVLRRRDF
jgi:hypothetical protein